MRFFLLGGGEDMLPLLRAIHHRHGVLGWCDCAAIDVQLCAMFPQGVVFERSEEARIDSNTIVAAGMSADLETHESRLRELARDGIPMVLVQPSCSAIFAMELDMIRRDTNAAMIPFHPASLHPAIEMLEGWSKSPDPPVGKIEQIVLERAADDRRDATVSSMLARDALLFRRLIGDFQQVGALQAGEDKSLSNLSVHLTGSTGAIARWSIGPVLQQPGAVISIIGEHGRVAVNMPEAGDWTVSSVGVQLELPTLEFDETAAILQQVEEGVKGGDSRPTWEDAYRCIDLADVASESVRRGKTLSINNEILTEEDTFKGMMAAGGCLIILALPLILLLVTLIDGLQIPLTKRLTIDAARDQRTVYLPSDLSNLKHVYLTKTGAQLSQLTAQTLQQTYGTNRSGAPQAFSISEGQISLAPVPDADYELTVHYRGSFNIGNRWPLMLLLPMLVFLLLQLLRLAFPKRPASAT